MRMRLRLRLRLRLRHCLRIPSPGVYNPCVCIDVVWLQSELHMDELMTQCAPPNRAQSGGGLIAWHIYTARAWLPAAAELFAWRAWTARR